MTYFDFFIKKEIVFTFIRSISIKRLFTEGPDDQKGKLPRVKIIQKFGLLMTVIFYEYVVYIRRKYLLKFTV